jgi:UDP-N-acetyl-D-mannosaminuronate dehydrogenase
MKNREQNKKMIEGVRRSFQQANHELYEQIRQKKLQNETLIKSERAKYLQSRVVNRVQATEDKDIRRRSINGFYESRSSDRRSSKSQEIADLLRKSEDKHRLCDEMINRNSRIREDKLKTSRI